MHEKGVSTQTSKTDMGNESPNKGDLITTALGRWGGWQARICLWMSLLKIPVAYFQLEIILLEAHVDYKCADASTKPIRFTDKLPDPCFVPVYEENYTEACTEWIYDDSTFQQTVVTEWDLVCEKSHWMDINQAIFMAGILLGSAVFGILSDRFGRKIPLLAAILLQALAGMTSALVPWFWVFTAVRFILAIATGGTLVISFVMLTESVGDRWRPLIAILYHVPYMLGISLMAFISYMLRNWRHFQLALGSISILYVSYIWLIPESPRWLTTTGRKERAIEVLKDAAKINKKDLSEAEIEKIVENQLALGSDNVNPSPLAVFSRPLRLRMFILLLNWFVSGLTYFGFSQAMGKIGHGDLYLKVVSAGLIGIPGVLITLFVLRFGRKISSIITSTVVGFCILGLIFVKEEEAVLHLMLTAAALTALAVLLPLIYLYSAELLPTETRNAGLGYAAVISRIGSIIAPFVKSQEGYMPLIIFGVGPLIGGLSIFFLPETKGSALPDTIEQIVALDNRNNNNSNRDNNDNDHQYIQISQRES